MRDGGGGGGTYSTHFADLLLFLSFLFVCFGFSFGKFACDFDGCKLVGLELK